jgi:hypothetical protein
MRDSGFHEHCGGRTVTNMAAQYVRNAETQLGKITKADVRLPETESGQRAIQIPEERLPQSKST